MSEDNHCRISFICLEHDNDSNCSFYEKKEKEIKGLKYNKCKYEFNGECINQDAQKATLEERFNITKITVETAGSKNLSEEWEDIDKIK